MTNRRSTWLLAIAPMAALVGFFWMAAVVGHYEQATGRRFYGLAAQHYSAPEWRMVYRPGGEEINFWVVTVPGLTTAAVILSCAVILTAKRWRELRWFPLLGLWAYHVVVLLIFGLGLAWVSVNVTGVFI